ncbi:MAG: TonB family protein [Candidatus Acidoferrum typicum]|nr:TonB family protein [Candidatus Acidoferrum typicum]
MRARCVFAVGVISLIILGAVASGWAHEAKQDANAVALAGGAALGAYPESADGLKKLVEDMFGVVKSKDEAKVSSYASALAIPEHGAWFVQTFGAAEGARLEAKYSEMLPNAAKDIRESFEYALKGKRTDVGVKVLGSQGEVRGLSRAIVDAMARPISVYVVDGNNPKEKFATHIGDFVYVDGGFRYVNSQVWQELSTAPPMRIRLGGNVAKANLINRVDPVYPDDARAARLEGEVLLHIVVATDGTIKELNLVKGDPVLAKAAMEAVKQWRYKPTLLNGKAVEVDSTISVVFRAQ